MRRNLDHALFAETTEEEVLRGAATATIIPLTRAMHTLVLHVQSRTSALGSVLWELSQDIEGVEWVSMNEAQAITI